MDRTGTGIAPVGKEPHQAHLVGLDGRGMSGLAQMLVQRGFVVTGSNPTPSPNTERLKALGVRVHAGHSPRSVPRSARLLVYSPEIPREHPDRLTAAKSGIEQASCSEMLARLLGRGIGVAATGGRKAGLAAAMVGWTLTHAGLDPTIVLGTGLPQLGGSGRLGLGPHVIVEAGDEPIGAELPGAEIVLIHDESSRQDRSLILRRWAEAAPPGGYVLGFADEGEAIDIPQTSLAEVERFSLTPGHDWWGADIREDRGRYRFRAFYRGRFALEVRLQVPGRHHVLGALAAVAVCGRVDLTSRAIKEGLEEFGGVSRGFESRGSYRGVTLVDDEALGPLAVGEALGVAREVFGGRRLLAAYRPSKGSNGSWPLPAEFVEADRVWIIDEEGPTAGSVARSLVEALVEAGSVARRASGLEEAILELDRHLEPGDVLVTLGAGDVGTIADAFLRRLSAIVTLDEPLAPHTWFRLGGPAAFLARPRNVAEVVALIRRAVATEVPVRVLGGGSNVLVDDQGFPGLVIHLESPAFSDVKIEGQKVEAGAAVPLTALISQTARAGLAGLEVLTGIPGTVGGALRGNSGGRQGAIGTFVSRVTVVDDSGEVLVREREDLRFEYRSSDLDEPMILSAEFELESEDPEVVVRRMRRIWIIKKENQPYGHQSSGCIFKNPTPELSAGILIERAGLKGEKVGGAEVSDRHANFIIAHPGAKSSDVVELIELVRQKVRQQFGHDLELQIKIW